MSFIKFCDAFISEFYEFHKRVNKFLSKQQREEWTCPCCERNDNEHRKDNKEGGEYDEWQKALYSPENFPPSLHCPCCKRRVGLCVKYLNKYVDAKYEYDRRILTSSTWD